MALETLQNWLSNLRAATAGRLSAFERKRDQIIDTMPVIIGAFCKSGGTIATNPDSNGNVLTQDQPKAPVELLDETLTWSGSAGYQYSSYVVSSGYRELAIGTIQTWTAAPSGSIQLRMQGSIDSGTTVFTPYEHIGNIPAIATGIKYWTKLTMECNGSGSGGHNRTGELMQSWGIGVNAAGGSPNGTVRLIVYGIR